MSDQANNMRSRELLHFYLSPSSNIHSFLQCEVYISYFGACHGKSELDSYFARVSKALKVLRLTECLSSISTLVTSLNEKFKQYEDDVHHYDFLKYVVVLKNLNFFSVNRDDIKKKTVCQIIIKDCKKYHYFHRNGKKLMASPLAFVDMDDKKFTHVNCSTVKFDIMYIHRRSQFCSSVILGEENSSVFKWGNAMTILQSLDDNSEESFVIILNYLIRCLVQEAMHTYEKWHNQKLEDIIKPKDEKKKEKKKKNTQNK
jgi:hypothetical protein